MNSSMNRFVMTSAFAITAFSLAACGGGGGGGGTPVIPGPSATPTPTPTPSVATASGKLVDDNTGAPLSGVSVGLAPWIADATPQPVATTAADGSFSFTTAPGHYLLVIGSDAASDTTRATIHDNVTLVGGANALKAPTLPPWPTVTPPAWETNGNYRLQTIDSQELPCFNEYNNQRTAHSLSKVVFDEWIKENTRDAEAWHLSPQYNGANQTSASHALSVNTFIGGGTSCSDMIDPSFTDSHAQWTTSPHNLWFAGRYAPYVQGSSASASGLAQFPLDPRFSADALGYPWP